MTVGGVLAPLFLLLDNSAATRPMNARTPITTPIPIPALAPVLRPLLSLSWNPSADVALDEAEDCVVEEVRLEEVEEVAVLEEDGEDEDELGLAARRTKNPGLDSCGLLWSYELDVALKRNTYFALVARKSLPMSIVQA
jgi:hypothetical protein